MKMSYGMKPKVERCRLYGGLTGESAWMWCCFLANEADMDNETEKAAMWKDRAESLKPKQGIPSPMSVWDSVLEDAIEAFKR